jgi:cytochrome c oxidase assembly protein subunit 15
MAPIRSYDEVTDVGETESPDPVGTAGPSRRGSYANVVLLATGLVYLTVLLGVSTRATGSGLACNANWPLCDGGILNLFPATVPSAFEWIHRVIAMFAGFAILGSAALAYRDDAPRRIMGAFALGTLLLPLQVLLGRETVVSFVPEVLAAHYWTAMAIYALFVAAAVWAHADVFSIRHVRRSLLGAVGLLPVVVVLGPPVVVRYSFWVQATQYAILLPAFAALLVAALVGRNVAPDRPAFRALLWSGATLVPVVVYLMRQRLVHPDSLFAVLHPVATVLLFVVVGVAAVLAYRTDPATSDGG